jgi:hypothetical protein
MQKLLENAREKATENYTRMMRVVRDENNLAANIYKSGETAKATTELSYLCFNCPVVSKKRQAHRKDHMFCELAPMDNYVREAWYEMFADVYIKLSIREMASSSATNAPTSSTIRHWKRCGQAMPRRGSSQLCKTAILND